MKFTHRLLSFLARLFAGVFHFGWWGALRVFVFYRWRRTDDIVSVPLRRLGRRLWFRACSDRLALSLLYTPGYRVVDAFGPPLIRTVVDAGANIGDSTLRLRRFHPQARIIAIEADPGNFQLLHQNFADDTSTLLLHRALWSHEGSLKVHSTWANIASRVHDAADNGEGISIPGCTVPGLMAELHLQEIDLLKLDIEGAEALVFQTEQRDWLRRVRCIIFECCDADDAGTTMAIFAALAEAGLAFNCHVCGENIVMIRHDTPWHLVADLWMEAEPSLPAHITASRPKANDQLSK